MRKGSKVPVRERRVLGYVEVALCRSGGWRFRAVPVEGFKSLPSPCFERKSEAVKAAHSAFPELEVRVIEE